MFIDTKTQHTQKGSDFMGKTKKESLTSEQITDARRLCEVIKGVPGGKRPLFEIASAVWIIILSKTFLK